MARRSLLPQNIHAALDQNDLTMRVPDRRIIKRFFGDPPLASGENEEDYWELFDFLCREARLLNGLDIPFLLNLASLIFEDRRLRHQRETLIRIELTKSIGLVLKRGGYKDEEVDRITKRWQRKKGAVSRDLERRLGALGTSLDDLRSDVLVSELETIIALDYLSAQNLRQRIQLRQELDRSKHCFFDEILLRVELKSKITPTIADAESPPTDNGADDP